MVKKFNEYINEDFNKSEDEHSMARVQLQKIIENAQCIIDCLDEMGDIPAWVQDKISVSNHSMDAICTWCDTNQISESSENKPTNQKLWDKALRLAKGTRNGGSASVRVDGKTYDAPNDGKGFEEYPSAYANSYAAKMYKSWGGGWRKVNEDLRDWHKEEWVRIDTEGNITGECGTMKDKDAPTRCLPKKKAQNMSKSERAATAKKKKEGGKKGKQFVSNTDKAKVSKSDRKKARS
jgi:hypothetical protein